MAHHAQGLGRVACDQNALALGEQMADKIADRVGFSSARRTLHQDSSMFFKLLGYADLLGIGGFAQKHFAIRWSGTALRWIRISPVWNRRFFPNNIQQRPGQVFARAEVSENTLDRSGESQGARAQEQDRIAANARVVDICVWCLIFEKLSARG